MDRPWLAAKTILSTGIPNYSEPFILEGVTNLEGNFRKDFLDALIGEVAKGKYNKNIFSKTLETLGSFMDKNTIESIQDRSALNTSKNRQLKATFDNSMLNRDKQKQALSKFSNRLLDGYSLVHPEEVKSMDSFAVEKELIGSGENFGQLSDKYTTNAFGETLSEALGIEAIDKSKNLESKRRQLLDEGYTPADIEANLFAFGDINSEKADWNKIKGDTLEKDQLLNKVLVGSEASRGFNIESLDKLLSTKVIKDTKGLSKHKVPYLTNLINKVRKGEASSTEILQLVNLGKSLGMIGRDQENLGKDYYNNIYPWGRT